MERLVPDQKKFQKMVWKARIVPLADDELTAEAMDAAAGTSLSKASPS